MLGPPSSLPSLCTVLLLFLSPCSSLRFSETTSLKLGYPFPRSPVTVSSTLLRPLDGRAFIGLYTVYVSRHSSKLVHEMTHFTDTIRTLNSQWASAPDVLIQTSSDAHENVINKVQHLLMELLRIKLLGTSAQGCS